MSADTDWTPDQPLRADATDEQIAARWHHNPTGNASKCTAEVAREFAAVAIREALERLAAWYENGATGEGDLLRLEAHYIRKWRDREFPTLPADLPSVGRRPRGFPFETEGGISTPLPHIVPFRDEATGEAKPIAVELRAAVTEAAQMVRAMEVQRGRTAAAWRSKTPDMVEWSLTNTDPRPNLTAYATKPNDWIVEPLYLRRDRLPHDRALQRLADTCYKYLGTESHEEVAAWIEDARKQVAQLKNELHDVLDSKEASLETVEGHGNGTMNAAISALFGEVMAAVQAKEPLGKMLHLAMENVRETHDTVLRASIREALTRALEELEPSFYSGVYTPARDAILKFRDREYPDASR